MRPRFFKRGKDYAAGDGRIVPSGFNEATLFQAWKAQNARTAVPPQRASMRPRFFKRGKSNLNFNIRRYGVMLQ